MIGIDLGGTKIEGAILGHDGRTLVRERIAAPRDSYDATLLAVRDLVDRLEKALPPDQRQPASAIGAGVPGSLSPATGLLQNANSTWLNGQPFATDLERTLGRVVRVANDANCFALSEAVDGSGAGHRIVFGVILGTGCGGGLVIDGRTIDGSRGIGGEWGHNPLPWATLSETPGPLCWCGRFGCMETWVSGPALAADHLRHTDSEQVAEHIAVAAAHGDIDARASLVRHAERLARGLAQIVNIIDPDVIVLGGGLSKLAHLYDELPVLMAPYIFASNTSVLILPPKWGDASGVRGAAWLAREP